jgi:hypothetical protein
VTAPSLLACVPPFAAPTFLLDLLPEPEVALLRSNAAHRQPSPQRPAPAGERERP